VSGPTAKRDSEIETAVTLVAAAAGGQTVALGLADLRRLAQRLAPFLAQELALVLPAGGNIPPADVSRRRGKEMRKWRREQRADECSDPIEYQDQDGESSWSRNQAAELLEISTRKKKQSK
jgi:hypothetical protein